MRELEGPLKDKILEGTEIRAEQEKKKELKLVGQKRKIRGHTMWQFNAETMTLSKAKFKRADVVLNNIASDAKKINIHQKVEVEKNCTYFQALNVGNALKKLRIVGFSIEQIKIEIHDSNNQ